MDRITIMNDGKESSSTVGDAAEIDTGEMETGRIGGHAETIYNREEMGVILKAMVIHPTPHTPKTDSGAGRTSTEVGWCDCRLLGAGKLYGTRVRDGAE